MSSGTNGKSMGMDFGDAIRALKKGMKVARSGWNGKGMWLILRVTAISWGEEVSIFKECVQPVPENMKSIEGIKGIVEMLPTICMKTADNKVLTGWLASKTDAEDWVIVE